CRWHHNCSIDGSNWREIIALPFRFIGRAISTANKPIRRTPSLEFDSFDH
ncbi:MAG: hypothetical protein ACI9A1_001665, partial [Lentimonas sp.]